MSLASLLAAQLRGGSAFLLGTPAELASLFGSPLPRLPDGIPDDAGIERLAVEVGPRLREGFARWLAAAARGLAGGAEAQAATAGSAAECEYLELLAQCLREVHAADRRQGLVNLFWLAHGREIAEEIEHVCRAGGAAPHLRYRTHPLVAGLLRRGEEQSRAWASRPQRLVLDYRIGQEESAALVDAIFDDQLPLTEAEPRAFDAGRVLVPQNPRFRIGAAAFEEIRALLRTALARAVAADDRGVRRALAATCPGMDLPAPADPPGAWDRLVYAEPLREVLLHDPEGALAGLQRSRVLRRELGPERPLGMLLEEFAEVTRCLRRAEAIRLLQRALIFESRGFDRAETRELFLEGGLLRFGCASAVQSSVRTATILFADIRGFTRASEGPVSEGELARELYEIFDPAALIVRRFGGTVDAYLGDGFMATFAGGARHAESALAAVRTAVALQQVLGRLRHQGRTTFRMGISLHCGRVSVARFLRDEREVQTTYIGRQVNVAGRLSSSAGEPARLAGMPGARCVGDVAVDAAGNLVNQGIAVSGALLAALAPLVPGEHFNEDGVEGTRWYDPELCLWLHVGYAGEARFRGLEATVPVYGLVAAAPATPPAQEA
ncbi:MAG TPA: adenylate/guanylate cyclase domain-containing protein [Candidatus Methanoperedens sp.]|nr:adenylate/guanylate cyclase domain-containing protein [Candidatus Methanoperedens sp.]